MEVITQETLDAMPGINEGPDLLKQALITVPKRHLFTMLKNLIEYDAQFVEGAFELSRRILSERRLFRNAVRPHQAVAHEIAREVSRANDDELGPVTHRQMALNFARSAGEYLGTSKKELETCDEPSHAMRFAANKVLQGYGIGPGWDERRILKGLGFHAMAEHTGAHEFKALDEGLMERDPDLVDHLKNDDRQIGGVRAYVWVEIHMTVEPEHAKAALTAANLAHEYYVGGHPAPEDFRAYFDRGCEDFLQVEQVTMKVLKPSKVMERRRNK